MRRVVGHKRAHSRVPKHHSDDVGQKSYAQNVGSVHCMTTSGSKKQISLSHSQEIVEGP